MGRVATSGLRRDRPDHGTSAPFTRPRIASISGSRTKQGRITTHADGRAATHDVGIWLLTDIRDAFSERSFISTHDLLVALRSDVTRVRYQLSQASAELQRLDEESRALTLQLGELKNPRRLAEIARTRGFGSPERIVELP